VRNKGDHDQEEIETMKDMQGLKLRTTGGAQDLTLRALGAVPVRMAAPDAYESLTRGTMDGLLFAMESVVAYGMDSLIKYTTDGVSFGSFIVAYSIIQSAWDRLPDDVKKALDEASEAIVPKVCAEVDNGQEWATTLDVRGKPASAALKEFNDLLAEAAATK
jgi:TRAP-type C4-dicarboxylate transport system substrate-binding protein